jgi:trimeric autotransporter adhesin
MESRQLLSTFTVSNVNDSGAGSLQAILQLDSDNNTTSDTIAFSLQGSVPTLFRIGLQSQLPTISRPVTIDASNLPLFTRNGVGLEIAGTAAGTTANGLQIDASNVTVRGLAIDGFNAGGVVIDGSVKVGVGDGANVTLDHDFIGLNNAGNDVSGTRAVPNGADGVYGEEAGKLWAGSRLKDRMQAIIAHEEAEYRTGSHAGALATDTELPVSHRAKEILRAMRDGWKSS